MGADPSSVDAVTERLRAETTVPGVLATAAQSFVDLLDAQACTISRVIGNNLLVDLMQHSREGKGRRGRRCAARVPRHSLLMFALESNGAPRGLVEIYERGRRFTDADVALAGGLAAGAGAALERLERPA